MKETNKVIQEIKAERIRQITEEEWDQDHDDGVNIHGELAHGAACYASRARLTWPWDSGDKRYKHPRRRRLIIAAALLVAEIERIDRRDGR